MKRAGFISFFALAGSLAASGFAIADVTAGNGGTSTINDAQAVTTEQLQQEIAALQQQLAALKQQQADLAEKQTTAASSSSAADADAQASDSHGELKTRHTIFGTLVTTGPSVRMQNYYDGSDLMVNFPSVNRDYAFLQREQTMAGNLLAAGAEPYYPYIMLSGNLEAQIGAWAPSGTNERNALGNTMGSNSMQSGVNLSNIELDTYIAINPWVKGVMTFTGSTSPSNANLSTTLGSSGSNVSIDLAQIIFGNLDKSPLYASIGQTYVPFGRYSYATVSEPLVRDVFRTKARAITLGSHPGEAASSGLTPYAELFVFNGDSVDGADNQNFRLNQGGGDAGAEFSFNKVNGELGLSMINNVGESQGINPVIGQKPVTDVPGIDVHGHVGSTFGPKQIAVTLVGEYAQATKHFDANDFSYNGAGAKPQAGTAEVDIGFKMGDHPITVAPAYSWTQQALGVGIPKDNYQLSGTIAILRDTLLSLEYKYSKYYPADATADGSNTGTTQGGHGSTVTGQVDIYF